MSERKETSGGPSLMGINEAAPVVGASEIEIAAAPETVWDVLTEIDRWPSWNPDIKSMSMQGPVAPGSVFRWKAGPGTITSTIRRVEPTQLIAWTGKTFGIEAIHFYRLDPRDGKDVRADGRVVRGTSRPTHAPLAAKDGGPHARRRTPAPKSRSRKAGGRRLNAGPPGAIPGGP